MSRWWARADHAEFYTQQHVVGITAFGLRFKDRGTQKLKDIPDDWPLYALA